MCWELDEYESWEAYQKKQRKQPQPQTKEPAAEVPKEEEVVTSS